MSAAVDLAAAPAPADRLAAALAAKPDGVVEAIAREAGVSPRDVLAALPAGEVRLLSPERFVAVWTALGAWREVLFIVHTDTVVLEVKGTLPAGSEGHGWFNVHGDSPIGGHIRKEACAAIALVDRPFHGRRSCSVWFLDGTGAAMFKVFVPRDAARALDPDALARFEALMAAA